MATMPSIRRVTVFLGGRTRGPAVSLSIKSPATSTVSNGARCQSRGFRARAPGVSVNLWSGFGPSLGRRGVSMTVAPKAQVVELVSRVVPAVVPEDDVAIKAFSSTPSEWKGDMIIIPVYATPKPEGAEEGPNAELTGPAKELDGVLGGIISEMIGDASFKGSKGEKVSTFVPGGSAKRVALVGAGEKDKENSDTVEALGASIAGVALDAKVASVLVVSTGSQPDSQALSSGVLGKLYADDRFRTGDNVSKPVKLKSMEIEGATSDALDAAVKHARGVTSGVRLAKDLVGAPPNYLTPSSMAGVAEKISKDLGLSLTILEQEECEKLGMGSYLGVAQGAIEPPKFIHLTYKPKGEVKSKIALIGKGLTFDSGGYNLKAGAGSMIELMKFDMGGSAAVLGAAQAIGKLKPDNVQVDFIVAACENMLSDRAMRPGDILTASNGKTIEVLNTDAEGRLTLADALIYAEKLNPDKIVDLATLTGACIISLGNEYAGMWSDNDDLAAELLESSKDGGEKLWRMPLVESYKEELKSKIADLKNVGGRAGGSITAALFLKEFVTKTPWAHIDMAGPVWDAKAGGSTGYGVRTLVEFVAKQQ
mmetsp:Transcript_26166/g.50858  ORF Transcript_26166/g.50858 Transcript_26166/m.50858 type:complete len:594 (+) Transcript_26166:27-1808(+)